MLEANKSIWFEKVFSIYNRNLLKRRFNSLNVSGLEFLSNRNKEIPTIVYGNHSSWWDGLVVFQLIQKTDLDFFVMMEEKQLKNLQIFRKLGAFSVVREKPRSAIQAINYSAKLLKQKNNRMILVFPQGEIQPNDIRPIKFYNGLSRIIEKLDLCQVYCLAIRYEFLEEFKPDIYVRIIKPELFKVNKIIKSKVLTENFTLTLTNSLNALKNSVLRKDFSEFQNLF